MAYILILGASSEIARALAHTYAENGFDLYLAARRPDRIEADVTDLKIRHQVEVKTVNFDAEEMLAHQHLYQSLDPAPVGVIAVTGYYAPKEKCINDRSEVQRIIDINYTGLVSFLDIVANDLEKRGEGFIIGLSSVAGDRGRGSNYHYGSAKAAFTTYLDGLRNRLFKAGVHVMTVKPGFVRTRMTDGMDLPEALVAEPKQVARDIYQGQQRRRGVLYTRWFWQYIMLIIQHIPDIIFKRLSL